MRNHLVRGLVSIIASLLVTAASAHQPQLQHSYVPPNGFIPDSSTAVRIAVAVWVPIYGANVIASERPFVATLHESVWTVTGTLPSGDNVGGTALAKIAKRDGRILLVTHSF